MTIIFTNTIKLWKMNKILKVKKKKVGWWLLGALSPSFTLWFTLGCSVFFITMYINILNWVYQVALLSATLGVFFYLIHVEMRIWTTRQKFCEAVLYVCLIRFNSYVQAFFFLFFFFLRKKCQPTPVFLPAESHRWRSLVGYSPWGHQSWIWLKWLSTST